MKKLLLPFIVLISLTVFGQVPETGLTAEYKFTNGRLDDAIGTNDLTQTGSALVFEDNRAAGPTKAISLNGDHLQRAATSDTDVSASFWVKTSTNDATYRVIVDQSERTSGADVSTQKGWYAYLKDGKIGLAGNYFYGHWTNTAAGAQVYTGYQYCNATTNVADGNWHHVTVTTQRSVDRYLWGGNQWIKYVRNIYKVYIDGVLENTNSVQVDLGSAIGIYMTFINGGQPITIANSKDANSADRYQDGFDDFRYYSRVLNATEVGQLASEAACSGTSGVAAVTQDITIALDASGNASIVAADIDNGSNAVCDEPFTLSLDITDFTCDDLGPNTVTLTATETYAGQTSSTATAIVTITYTPEVIAQDITVQLDVSGNATITPQDVNDGTPNTGICGFPLTLSLNKLSFTCADLGTNSVILTADDGDGNFGMSTINVVVEDNVAPAILAQNIAVMVDAMTGFVSISAAMIDNGSTDNCDSGSLTLSLSKTQFRCVDTGDNLITLSVEDTNGNIATEDVIVTVTSEINDETVTAASASFCPDGSSGTTISTGSSVVGFDYSLRKSEDNSLIDGPFAGTGSSLDLATGNISETTTFNVFTEKALATSQSALDFDGVDDYVTLGNDNRGVSTQVTVAAWIKTTNSGATQFISSKYDFTLGYYLYMDSNGKAAISGRDGSGAGRGSGFSTKSVNDGEWHYVAGSVNVLTGNWSVYVDGILENTTNAGTGTTLANVTNHILGLTSGLYFSGEMDQVTIWDTELDATTILTNMNSCLTGAETNIVGHFIFEDGSGTTLTDQSTSSLDGILTNMDGATDWIQVLSPSCGEKVCDYQLSTEITVGDDVSPTAIAQDITIQLDLLSGEQNITPDMIDNGSSDNCTGALIKSISQSLFTCQDAGEQTITLTIEDISGNTSTAMSTVTVVSPVDDETITVANSSLCPDGSSTTISTGSSVSGVKYYLRNSNDDSIIDGPIIGTGSGIDFNTGAISETTTFNVYANQATNNEAITVAGNSGYVSVPNSTSLRLANDWTLEAWVKPTGPTVNIIESYDGNGGFVLRGNGSKWQAYAMFSSASSHNVVSATSIVLNEWVHVAATFNETTNELKMYINGVLDATNSSATIDQRGSLQPIKLGARGDDNAIQNEHIQDEVRIWNVERTAQEIDDNMSSLLTGSETGLVAYYGYNDLTFQATNMTIEDLSSNANNGTVIGTYTVANFVSGAIIENGSCAFQMTTEVTITGGDDIAPTATVQDINIQLDASGNATITTVDINTGSFDNCTPVGNLVLSIDKMTFTCADLGANTVTLTVEDSNGNQSTAAATVTIEDAIAPTAAAQDVILQLDASGNVSITTVDINNSSSDNCTVTNSLVLSLDKTAFTCADLGANTVTLTVEDASGNQTTSTATVTIEDINAPTALSQDITIQLDANGTATVAAAEVNNGSSDVCTAANSLVLSLDRTSFTCADLGVNMITLTVSDESANQSTATATVTVEDNIAPTAIAQDLTLVLNGASSISITPEDIDNGSSDICDVTLSLDMSTFTVAQIGEHIVTLTVEDASGNMSTATATVTVTDKTAQTISFEMIADRTFGDDSFEITGLASSQLLVVFSVVSGPVTLTNGTVSIIGAGQATIRASQAGDATFASAQLDRTFNIAKADQVLTIEPITDRTVAASPITISASVDTNLDLDYTISGPATIADNVVSLSGTIGTVGVTVTQPGNDNYNPISQTINFTVVNQTAQTIVFSPIDDKTYGGDVINLTASSDSELTVSLVVISGPVTLSGSTLSMTGVGEVIVEATQEGDVTFLGAVPVRQQFMVNKAMLTAMAEDISITYGTAVPELIFSYVGFVNGESASVLSIEPTISTTAVSENGVNAGTYAITLDGGQADNYLITLVNGTLDIAKADQQITVSPIDTKLISDTDFEVVASVDTNLELIYEISGPATISGTTVSLDGDVGVVTITITQLGNINYNETSETLDFDVAVPAGIANDLLEIKIFPNPSTSYIQIETPKRENLRAIMFDLNGSLLWSKPISSINNQFDVSSLKVGAYILKIQSEDHTTTTKILIER